MTDAQRIASLQRLGYTAREAAFLSLVALHGGYFIRRQYQRFAGYRGRLEERFLRRADSLGHIRSEIYPNRTEVYHVFARAIYRAVGDEDNRNRRPRSAFSIKAKLMALDFVLAHPAAQFLATEGEKLEHFCGQRAVDRTFLPGKTYSASRPSGQTRRYFIEKYPIFLDRTDAATPPLASFCYVDEGVLSNSGFTSFLKRYGLLFAALGRFRLVYVAAEHKPFRRAERAFDRFTEALANPEAATPGGRMGDYFRLRRLLETRQYGQLNKAKLDRLRDLSQRFSTPRPSRASSSGQKPSRRRRGWAGSTRTLKPTDCRTATTFSGPIPVRGQPPEGEHLIAAGAPLLNGIRCYASNRQAFHNQQLKGRREPLTALTANAGWAGATPCFWALVRPKPSRLRLGSLPPTLRQNHACCRRRRRHR